MTWIELSIEVPGEYAEPVSHLYLEDGEGAAVIETPGGFNPDEGEAPPVDAPVIVRTYIPEDATAAGRRTMIDVGLRLIAYLCPLPDLKVRLVDDDEWKNQRFEPIRIGRRLVIAPPDSFVGLGPTDIAIPLEPGLAFGTGHHPTTAMVLSAMEEAGVEGATVLDAGCGSGILSIAAIKLGARQAVAFDVEDDSIRSTTQNAERAGVASKIKVIHGSLPDSRVETGAFDFVFANISANVLKLLSVHLLATLNANGVIIASGVLEERYSEVESAFNDASGVLFDKQIAGDWTCFKVRRA
ncbi:MAG: 50S ribosomal protein L11 methyltransferase [Chloroflexi bacterium]|nr:50S ribosomal protein L11 methyltransferase [Chloroflexota bacterium]